MHLGGLCKMHRIGKKKKDGRKASFVTDEKAVLRMQTYFLSFSFEKMSWKTSLPVIFILNV